MPLNDIIEEYQVSIYVYKIIYYRQTSNEVLIKQKLSKVCEYIMNVAESLSEDPYKEKDLISSTKRRRIEKNPGITPNQENYYRILMVFIIYIKVIPGVSTEKAKVIMRTYPTLNQLLLAYDELYDVKSKKEMLMVL